MVYKTSTDTQARIWLHRYSALHSFPRHCTKDSAQYAIREWIPWARTPEKHVLTNWGIVQVLDIAASKPRQSPEHWDSTKIEEIDRKLWCFDECGVRRLSRWKTADFSKICANDVEKVDNVACRKKVITYLEAGQPERHSDASRKWSSRLEKTLARYI